MYQYRDIDLAVFHSDILYDLDSTTSVDDYVELFNGEVQRIVDKHAPLKSRTRRIGRNDCRWLFTRHARPSDVVGVSSDATADRSLLWTGRLSTQLGRTHAPPSVVPGWTPSNSVSTKHHVTRPRPGA